MSQKIGIQVIIVYLISSHSPGFTGVASGVEISFYDHDSVSGT